MLLYKNNYCTADMWYNLQDNCKGSFPVVSPGLLPCPTQGLSPWLTDAGLCVSYVLQF